jgi:bis(5'-nucleosyl)-tetraphosphatase (symmetrical)
MARYAIGDVQGCADELRALLDRLLQRGSRPALVRRRSRQPRPALARRAALRQALGDNAIVVLGNHDLHLLARAHGGSASA